MTNKIFKFLPALFFILTSSAYSLPTNQFYGGFELGVGNETLQYKNSYNLTGSAYPTTVNYTTPFNYDVNSSIFTGGVMLGYARAISERFGVNYELLAIGNAGDLYATDQLQSPFTYTPAALQEYTAKTKVNLFYAIDLVVKPTFAITRELSGFLKGGVSTTELNTSLTITHNNALTNEVYTATNGGTNKNIWGFVIGAGLELVLTDKCSLFGEYNFHEYQTKKLKTVTITDNGSGALPGESVTNTITYMRRVLPYINSFNVGLHYYF